MIVENTYLRRLLALWAVPGLGPVALRTLLDIDQTLELFFEKELFHSELRRRLPGLPLLAPDWRQVDKLLVWGQKTNQHLIYCGHPQYPNWLAQAHGLPSVLFVQGSVSVLSSPQIGIVGTRRATRMGLHQASRFAKTLALHGLTITSGLALGIDTAAHEAAVAAGGRTIAVLAGGLNHLYPSQNRKLAAEILATDGALVSELPPEQQPQPKDFARRNRIISGLSQAILVVEAPLKSGALITAQFALEQNREVFAISGEAGCLSHQGCHALIKQGAQLVDQPEEILTNHHFYQSLEKQGGVALKKHKENNLRLQPENQKEDVEPTPFDAVIGNLIGWEMTSIDWVVDQSGLSIQQVNLALANLMMAGAITPVPGGYAKVPR